DFLDATAAIVRRAEPAGALVVVNDRADIARLGGAAGVHVGQDDLSPAQARALVGADAVVGLSTHTTRQLDVALQQNVNYVAMGPVFGTATKETGYEPIGLEMVRTAAARAASAAAAMPSRGRADPRRGISESSRWGWGPSATGKKWTRRQRHDCARDRQGRRPRHRQEHRRRRAGLQQLRGHRSRRDGAVRADPGDGSHRGRRPGRPERADHTVAGRDGPRRA
ncbi:MAG: thiamine phosphate synthase, partial [Planctomycetes bacterium]|nr:thiamine phosphate synthase [Planctomycetota bacterium]